MIGKFFNFDFSHQNKGEKGKQENSYQEMPYSEEAYEDLATALTKTINVLEQSGASYMVRGGFAIDLLGKEKLNRLIQFKASDIDIDVASPGIEKAVDELKKAGFLLEDQKFYTEEADPTLYKFREPATQASVDIFKMQPDDAHLATRVKLRNIDFNLQSPSSLYETTLAETEGRYKPDFPDSIKRQRSIKVGERLKILQDILINLKNNQKYLQE
ncbi:MAG: hypothetical protein WC863_02305 [Patescibacteria group bacterium]